MTLPYSDRAEAGSVLAEALREREPDRPVVLALPRGGVPVAKPCADALNAPLDVFVVRKLGAPGQPELALGAIATGGVRVLNDRVVSRLRISHEELKRVAAEELTELRRRERAYRGNRQPLEITGRTVLLVDDGLATGATMRAAVQAVRAAGSRRIVVAVPVGAAEACRQLARTADDVVCLAQPVPFGSVGRWYRDFAQTTDEDVRRLLCS